MTHPDVEHFQEPQTDVSDKATAVEMLSLHYALAEANRAAKRQQEPGPDGAYPVLDCIECGDEIGEKRLAVAIKNLKCIHCATAEERRR